MTTTHLPRRPAERVLALAVSEVRLALRNRTVAVTSIAVPLVLGVVWNLAFGATAGLRAMPVALQLAVTLAIGVYSTATQTLVARRHALVLKRLRTTDLPAGGIVAATTAPSVAVAAVQLAVFAVLDALTGTLTGADPLPLALAVLTGLALVLAAAVATSTVTSAPERSQITTLPLTFAVLVGAVALSVAPLTGWWQAALVVPGTGVGALVRLAVTGGTWAPGALGLPAVVAPTVSLGVWALVLGLLARRRFRFDTRR